MMSSLAYTKEVPLGVYDYLFGDVVRGEVALKDLDFTLEAIDSIMETGINPARKFNLKGYIYNARVNDIMSASRKEKKVLHIYNAGEENEEDSTGVCENIISDGTDQYEDLILADELRYTLIKLKKIYTDILIHFRLDIWGCLEQAVQGVPSAQKRLKDITEEDAQIGEVIYILLSSTRSIKELKEMYENL